jgi:PAS domain S-box-containing protein
MQASEPGVETLLNRLGGAALVADARTGQILAWNPAAADLLGYSPEEALRLPLDAIFPGVALPMQPEAAGAASPAGPGLARELVSLRKTGESLRLEAFMSPLHDLQGSPAALLILRDRAGRPPAVRAAAETEAALQATRELNRTLLESIPQRIFFKDHCGVFQLVNAPFAADLGLRPEELVGRTDYDFYPRELAEKYRADDVRVMASGRAEVLEEANVVQGQERTVEVVKAPVLAGDGTVRGVLGVFTDITHRKRLEEELREAQKMDAVGRLAGGVAHEFNNLLMAITGFSELLLLKMDSTSPLRRYAGEIRTAADRAAALTRQLLAFGRKQMLTPQVLDLNTVVNGMQALLQRRLGEDVDLALLRGPNLGLVRADPGQVEEVLLHLAQNAGDAMPGGGRLAIETRNVEIDQAFLADHPDARPGAYVLMAVTDTGSGMDEEVQSHLFEPFFTTKEVGEGLGMGLATVYGIVKQSGGQIAVESAPGQGTSVRIYLPRLVETEAPAPPVDAFAASLRGTETILVAEDEEMVRSLIREVLERNGYRVLAAAIGGEALAMVERAVEPVHLLVADIVMPGMSGPELAAQLRERQPELKVIYMSAYSEEQITAEGLGEATLLRKPFAPDLLARTVRELLD